MLNVAGGLELTLLKEFRERFTADAKNQLAQNICVKHDLLEVLRVSQMELTPHVYNHKVDLYRVYDILLFTVDIGWTYSSAEMVQ